MKTLLATTVVCLSFAAPVLAQTAPATPTAPSTTEASMTPTAAQCTGGYKDTYMQSMKWSKATFDTACAKVLKK